MTNTPERVERLRATLADCPICGSPVRRNGKKGNGGVVCYAGSHRLQVIAGTQPAADIQWNEMAKDWADRQDRDAIVEKNLRLIEHIASVEHVANAIDRNGLNSRSFQLRNAARIFRAALSAPSPASGEVMRLQSLLDGRDKFVEPAAPQQLKAPDKTYTQIENWFFRELSDEQRLSLITIVMGNDCAKEASTRINQRRCFAHIIEKAAKHEKR